MGRGGEARREAWRGAEVGEVRWEESVSWKGMGEGVDGMGWEGRKGEVRGEEGRGV